MVVFKQDIELLRKNIKKQIDYFDSDKIREISNFIARRAGKKAMKLAGEDWDKQNITRKKIEDSLKKYRSSKYK